MKKWIFLLLCSIVLFSCWKSEVSKPDIESDTWIVVEWIENEVSTGVEAELSRDLNNLLNDVSNEQE